VHAELQVLPVVEPHPIAAGVAAFEVAPELVIAAPTLAAEVPLVALHIIVVGSLRVLGEELRGPDPCALAAPELLKAS